MHLSQIVTAHDTSSHGSQLLLNPGAVSAIIPQRCWMCQFGNRVFFPQAFAHPNLTKSAEPNRWNLQKKMFCSIKPRKHVCKKPGLFKEMKRRKFFENEANVWCFGRFF